jgi:hypothetical protein
MTAALKQRSPRKLPYGGIFARRARPLWVEAGVSREEMGKRTWRARRGKGPSAYARFAEIMSGRAISQQGLVTTCKDPSPREILEVGGGRWSGARARTSEEEGVTPF